MEINEFQDILILETPYYKKLQRIYRETSIFRRYIDVLKKISTHDNFIAQLDQQGNKELVFFGRRVFSLQQEFVTTYLDYLENESSISKWEPFFERYSKSLLEMCQKFVGSDGNKVLIFEIVNRKLLGDLLSEPMLKTSLEKKIIIAERFGLVINKLFNYIRNTLAKKVAIVDNLIVESYEKIPLIPKCRASEATKLLRKQFLKRGLPEQIFMAVLKSITTLDYVAAKESIIKMVNEASSLSKDSLSEILSSHFFVPDEKSLVEIIDPLRRKATSLVAKCKEKREIFEKKTQVIQRKIRDSIKDLSDNLINAIENLSTEESVDNLIRRMRLGITSDGYDLRILKGEYQKYFEAQLELNSIMNFEANDLAKFIVRSAFDPFIVLLLNRQRHIDQASLQQYLKEAMKEIKDDPEADEIMSSYRTGGFLKGRFDTTKIKMKFQTIVEEVILPMVRSFLLAELVDYYPKLSGVTSPEGLRYVAEEALSGRANVIEKDIGRVVNNKAFPELNIHRYKNMLSVLVYDIRGSTFMGTKLMDAKKESEIRNFFQESMLTIIERFGGIPIKDTGDGGLILFVANYDDIKYGNTLIPQPGSALGAIRSAIAMVKEARSFVEENIKKYKDWFKEAEERYINFEGATYATLPPSYKSIFQIGVGVASGIYPKEVFLDSNVYGEMDLTGTLVREANFYSTIKAEVGSTIICDDATIYNLLLNVDKFSFLSETGLRTDPIMLDAEQGLEYWINQKVTRRGFIFDLYKIFVSKVGEEVNTPGQLRISLGSNREVVIGEAGEMKDEKGGRRKFLFEVFSEESR